MKYSLDKLLEVHKKISPYLLATNLENIKELSNYTGCQLLWKFESHQITGSFKVRGALNSVLNLKSSTHKIIAASSGNHGIGVAYSAQQFNVPCTVVMPITTNKAKVDKVIRYGGNVVFSGKCYDEAVSYAKSLRQCDSVFVPSFDSRDIIMGQATVFLDIIRQLRL